MIYVCYGATKSASTFIYELTEQVFRAKGNCPFPLDAQFKGHFARENFFESISLELIKRIKDVIGDRSVVLKTHQAVDKDVAGLIASGRILASATIRDPREMALSMIDHGRRTRRLGRREFSSFVKPLDTLDSIDEQFKVFQSWRSIQGVEIFRYNDICFDTVNVVGRIAKQLGGTVEPSGVLEAFPDKRRIGQFNSGIPLRYREMRKADQALFLARYASLYENFSFENPAAKRAGSRPGIRMRSLFKRLVREISL